MIGKVKTVSVSSRASVKIKDSFYTFEYGEERELPPDLTEEDLELARQEIWIDCNAEVDRQIEDVVKMFK